MKRFFLLLLTFLTLSSLYSQAPVKKVLVEKFTSAFCGNCPIAALDLYDYESMNPNLIWVAHHSPWVLIDAMHTTDIDPYYSNYTNGAPKATIDRKKYSNQSGVAVSSSSWNTHITNQTASTADLSVAISGTYDNVTREINVDVTSNFYNAVGADDRRVNLFFVETDISVPNTQGYNQSSYGNNDPSSPLYGLGNPITNYVHKNVTRAVLSDTWGTTGAIPTSPAVNTDYTQSFTYTIPANYTIANSYLVAFVTSYDPNDINNHEVLNAETLEISQLMPPEIELDVQLWMEGAYDKAKGVMNTRLQQLNLLPSLHPYIGPPWNYPGMEGMGWTINDYPTNTVDWVKVSFRTSPTKNSEVVATAAVLLDDGTLFFPNSRVLLAGMGNSFYVVVEHRNHIGAMSAFPASVVNNKLSYDFREENSYVLGFGQKEITSGVWGLYAGDGDQINQPIGFDINGLDNTKWNPNNGLFNVYLAWDYNLDGDVNGADKILWNGNNGIFSQLER